MKFPDYLTILAKYAKIDNAQEEHMKPYRGFADEIRHRRKQLNLTLSQVAEKMGWSIPYVSELERGVKQPPPAEGVKQLALVLQLDSDELITEAALSRRSIEIDLEGIGLAQRRLALLLARRFDQGLSDEEAIDLLHQLEELDDEDDEDEEDESV